MAFLENPFIEKSLCFTFPSESPGATRYETWTSHLAVFQKNNKEAVDFIHPDEKHQHLYLTEIKDFYEIMREGVFKHGNYSIDLAKKVATKVKDTIAGMQSLPESATNEEKQFVSSIKGFSYRAVFHWEFNPSLKEYKRKLAMQNMKLKLRQPLQGFCTQIFIENISDNPSKHWNVTRH